MARRFERSMHALALWFPFLGQTGERSRGFRRHPKLSTLAAFLAPFVVVVLPLTATAQDWPAVREVGLEIAPDSPLDFSALLPNGTIRPDRHLVVSGGHFVFSNDPTRPVPLLCASLAWSPASGGFPDHDTADRYARQLARHGYNLARFHFVEASLMAGREADFDFDPETLDRFHYLLAALKRAGISWVMDGLTSPRGGMGGYDDRWSGMGGLKQQVLLTSEGFVHWQRLQSLILGTVNPYTGLAPIADPALALIVLVNEGGLEFDTIVGEGKGEPAYPALVRQRFNAWLREHYADSVALDRAWGGLAPEESLEAGTIGLPTNRYAPTPRLRDLQLFFLDVERAGTAAMSAYLREMGYRGAISNYNNWPTLQASLSRQGLDVVTMNTYFDWVSSYTPGTRITQESSVRRGLDYLRAVAGTRWLGRPFLLTEYDHLFWNRYRYEAGLAVPALAALQGWDGLCRHGHGPIILRYGENFPHKRQMLPYAIALDPVARAGETLSALLFRRGDVRRARATIALPVASTNALGPNIEAREPGTVTALMAFSGIGLAEAGTVEGSAVPVQREGLSLDAVLTPLARTGVISQEQIASARQGIYLSDTGEIAVIPERGLMRVTTSRTVAAAFTGLDEPLELGPLTLSDPSGPALVALSSLDGAPLEHSQRILVIFATDAHNSDMRFADAGQRVIEDFGHLPVRIRPASVSLRLIGNGDWVLSPVGLDGVVHDPVAAGSGLLEWRLDNVPPSGPTTYFFIERD